MNDDSQSRFHLKDSEFVDWVDESLPKKREREIEQHLRQCSACRRRASLARSAARSWDRTGLPALLASSLESQAQKALEAGDLGKVERILRRALRLLDPADLAKRSFRIRILQQLTEIHKRNQDFSQAGDLLKQTLEEVAKLRGEDHPDYAFALNKLAEICLQLGDAQKAESWLDRAEEILDRRQSQSTQGKAALGRSFRRALHSEENPELRGRLKSWLEDLHCAAEGAVQVVLEHGRSLGAVWTEGVDELLIEGAGWQKLSLAGGHVRGRHGPEAELYQATWQSGRISLKGLVPPVLRISNQPGRLIVTIEEFPAGMTPIAALLPKDESIKGRFQQMIPSKGGFLAARFESLVPADYQLLIEPLENIKPRK